MTDHDELVFARKRARRSDPDTSHQAARQAPGLAKRHRAMILAYLKGIAPRGKTIEGIANNIPLDKVAVARRMGELASDKAAHPDGTALLSTGRPGRVWFAGEAARG